MFFFSLSLGHFHMAIIAALPAFGDSMFHQYQSAVLLVAYFINTGPESVWYIVLKLRVENLFPAISTNMK